MSERILNVKVGEPLEANLARAARTMEALDRGETPAPYFGVGFSDVGQLFAVFTPRRWDLLAALRESGPMTIAELARRLKRDYKNVHGDVEKLAEWQAVEKDEKGRIVAPYSEIVVDVRLPPLRHDHARVMAPSAPHPLRVEGAGSEGSEWVVKVSLAPLIGDVAQAAFMGRIGAGPAPLARSLRIPLNRLLKQ